MATGGDQVHDFDGVRYHEFTSSGDFILEEPIEIEWFGVAGGGGGSGENATGGAGGSGKLVLRHSLTT